MNTTTKYKVCNNYNMLETVCFDLAEASRRAQAIANRDRMPAFVDVYLNGYCDDDRSFKVNPEQEPTQARSLADVAEDVG